LASVTDFSVFGFYTYTTRCRIRVCGFQIFYVLWIQIDLNCFIFFIVYRLINAIHLVKCKACDFTFCVDIAVTVQYNESTVKLHYCFYLYRGNYFLISICLFLRLSITRIRPTQRVMYRFFNEILLGQPWKNCRVARKKWNIYTLRNCMLNHVFIYAFPPGRVYWQQRINIICNYAILSILNILTSLFATSVMTIVS